MSESTPPADSPVTITVLPNGPLEVTGAVRIVGTDGSVTDTERTWLCRCGHSAKKPLCDGSHKREGFVDPVPAD